ncbi:hypothetical protein QL285_042474 [Trifolium repens]|nr:hypothetical protein QL285_042474 [Trifolium repens]
MYEISHTKRNRSYVNDEARQKNEELQKERQTSSDNKAFVTVFGKEHHGYVRGMGLGPTPSQINGSSFRPSGSISSSTADAKIAKMQSEIDVLTKEVAEVNELKAKVAEFDAMKEQFALIMANMQNHGSNIGSPFEVRRSSESSHNVEERYPRDEDEDLASAYDSENCEADESSTSQDSILFGSFANPITPVSIPSIALDSDGFSIKIGEITCFLGDSCCSDVDFMVTASKKDKHSLLRARSSINTTAASDSRMIKIRTAREATQYAELRLVYDGCLGTEGSSEDYGFVFWLIQREHLDIDLEFLAGLVTAFPISLCDLSIEISSSSSFIGDGVDDGYVLLKLSDADLCLCDLYLSMLRSRRRPANSTISD